MATPDQLTCDYHSLVNEVGQHLYGLRPTAIDVIADGVASAGQASDILRCIAKGLQFVYSSYRWSFLRPRVAITTVASTNTYAMPAGVDSLEGTFTYPQGIDYPVEPLFKIPEMAIRRMLANNSTPGKPKYYAEVTATFDPTTGSTRSVTFFPIPDAAYVLTAIGTLRPSMVDASNKYPLGVEVLAPCIVESCLAVAERDFDQKDANAPDAVHNRALTPLLQMAIQRDKEYASPDSLGVDDGDEGSELYRPRQTGSIAWNAGGGFNGTL